MRGGVCLTAGLDCVGGVDATEEATYIDEKLDPHGGFEREVVGSLESCISLQTLAEANGGSVPRVTIARRSETFGPLKEVRH